MDVDLRAYRRRDYVRAAYRTNLMWGKEIKKLRKIITRVMESHKENADSELYLDLLCLRTYKVDLSILLYEELKHDRFRNITELDRLKDGVKLAIKEYIKIFNEYNH